MSYSQSTNFLKTSYLILLVFAIVSSAYALFRPGLSIPRYPKSQLEDTLNQINTSKLLSTSTKILKDDSSDRKVSPLHVYKYDDGSEIRSAMVRVKKRDDFKIETYGLLTKNLDAIYIRNPASTLNSRAPFSASGPIDSRRSIQTCIIPFTRKLDQADIRLQPLTSNVENLRPTKTNFFRDRILGRKKPIDYSCLVLTYFPASSDPAQPITDLEREKWSGIVQKVQDSFFR